MKRLAPGKEWIYGEKRIDARAPAFKQRARSSPLRDVLIGRFVPELL